MLPFIDLATQQARIRPQIDAAIARVLDHGKYIMGPEVAQLENELCEFVGSKHCITVSNGTDALIASLMALEFGPGDAVITTPFTFFATVEAIMSVGATPVFADIDPHTFNVCPDEIVKAIVKTKQDGRLRLRAIMTVDLFGLCADYESINQIAKQNNLLVIQDAAQAFGASTSDGRRAPTHGLVGTTSFFPAKPFGCYGDGGAVFTDDDELAETIRSIRVHGKGADKYDNIRVGQNCRLSTMQAAILLEKLKIYQSELDARETVAAMYSQHFERLNEQQNHDATIGVPQTPEDSQSAWAQYTLRLKNREQIAAQLKKHGIPTTVYYRTPSHLLGACRKLGYETGDFPNAELAANEVLSLPFHPYMNKETISIVLTSLKTTVGR
ncbi:DegT/DnrJ/EryC1/StrS family aminotransferase [Mariniblastus sp.]|nr:DegT/DnrJ/EryC1/StrS family aminotransferase [Mariniblastus sp.]